jgi:hypothetical protein
MSDDDLDDHVWLALSRQTDLTERSAVEALEPLVQAWLVTRVFEWQVGNGGLYQYFLNFEDRPWFLNLVLHGYDLLGLADQRRVLEETITPLAFSNTETRLREQARSDPLTEMADVSELESLDELVQDNTEVRLRVVRANPGLFVG